eukprot:8064007-Pyramimonas_sp.AAC.1
MSLARQGMPASDYAIIKSSLEWTICEEVLGPTRRSRETKKTLPNAAQIHKPPVGASRFEAS